MIQKEGQFFLKEQICYGTQTIFCHKENQQEKVIGFWVGNVMANG